MSTPKILLLLGTFCAAISAQTAVVERQANLRRDPSAAKTPIATLLPEDKLTVLDSSTSPTYLKVKTAEGKTGWVFKKFVEVMPAAPSSPPPPPPPPPPSDGGVVAPAGAGSAPATAIDKSWEKPDPVSKSFEGSEGACADKGDGGDSATNLRKNRVDPLPAAHDVAWSAINSLAFPAAKPSRLSWTPAQLAQIKPFEGVSLRVVAFLSHQVKVETEGRGESTNCHFTQPEDVDWHVYLTEHPNEPIAKAVIIETTPRIRVGHKWDPKVLERWVNKDTPVRVSGFLMLDPEHRDMIGSARSTVWELHPVMKIEVCKSTSCTESEWADLDTVQ
jgi:hypothetical protein